MNPRDVSRRALGGLLGTALLGGWFAFAHRDASRAPDLVGPEWRRRGLLRPPGSVDEEEFLARCIRCQRCAQVCSKKAIRLLGPGYGRLEGTPVIVPETSACDLCLACGDACPAGAIRPLERMDQARMGTAGVDPRLCVSHAGTGICGACFTVCPLRGKAIRQGLYNRPTVFPDACAGCGLCEEACIVEANKAIRVTSPRSWS